MSWAGWLQLFGTFLGLVGALLMANCYTAAVESRGLLSLLGSALIRGDGARSAADWKLKSDDRLTALQGLALVAIAFLLQLLSGVITLFA